MTADPQANSVFTEPSFQAAVDWLTTVPMRTRIKICCISSEEEAEAAIAAGADALGLVGDMPSGPGVIDDALAQRIAVSAPPPIATFLLTQETRAIDIARHVVRCGTNTVQIVNHIHADEHERLTELLPPSIRRVQVVHVEDGGALDMIAAYEPYVDAFLLDSGRPSAAVPELGGTGRVHDWEISRQFVKRASKPVFLAGGLTADNARRAIETVKPYGLDICSGIRSDGKLSCKKLADFMARVRG